MSWRDVHDGETNLGDDFEDEGRQRREEVWGDSPVALSL